MESCHCRYHYNKIKSIDTTYTFQNVTWKGRVLPKCVQLFRDLNMGCSVWKTKISQHFFFEVSLVQPLHPQGCVLIKQLKMSSLAVTVTSIWIENGPYDLMSLVFSVNASTDSLHTIKHLYKSQSLTWFCKHLDPQVQLSQILKP